MFSGIIEGMGTLAAIRPMESPQGRVTRLELDLGPLRAGLVPGASVAVSGVCLTVAAIEAAAANVAAFDVIPETLRLTNLGELAVGDAVNLERSLRVGERVDGHFVQGHVDGCGEVTRVERRGEWRLWVRAALGLMPYIVKKGSVALDGVSLTVAEVQDDEFCVALIPATLERTTLSRRGPGDRVNIETDILARLVLARLDALLAQGALPPGLAPRGQAPLGRAPRETIDLETLRAAGFVK